MVSRKKTKTSTKIRRVSNLVEILAIERTILESVDKSFGKLKAFVGEKAGLDFLHDLKFLPIALDPLDPERPLNFIEHLNQTFTCLVTLKAASCLLKRHPGSIPLVLTLGATGGIDVLSEDGSVAAEAFAATSPKSNDKLKEDLLKLKEHPAKHRYVFFYCPGHEGQEYVKECITVVPLDSPRVLPRLPTKGMGPPLVDYADRNALYDLFDEEEFPRLYGIQLRK